MYSWPACEVEWPSEERALWAIPFPGGPEGDDVRRYREESKNPRGKRHSRDVRHMKRRSRLEGSLIIATSDASIKFHQIWPENESGGHGTLRVSAGRMQQHDSCGSNDLPGGLSRLEAGYDIR